LKKRRLEAAHFDRCLFAKHDETSKDAAMVTIQQIKEFRTVLRNSDRPLDMLDPYYLPNIHGTGAEDVVERLFASIEETQATGLFYFTGQRGTGKSTELLRLKQRLDGAGKRCILFDSLHYFNDTQSISAELLMLMVAAGIDDWISQEHPKEQFGDESVFGRFRHWMKIEVALEKAQLSVGVAQLSFNLKPNQESVREKIQKLGSRQRFHGEIIAFISDMCRWLEEREGRKVVVVVDSLERLRGSAFASSEQDSIYNQVAEVFSDQLELLKVPNLKLVYSVPPYLTLLQNVRSQVALFSLASVRVYEDPKKKRRQPRDSGLEYMRQLVGKRLPAWQHVFTPEALNKLALLSGGDLRQFILRILIDTLTEAEYALERLPLADNDVIIQNIETACASEMLQLTVRDEWPLLASVSQDNNPIAQNKDQLKTLAHLLEVKVILNYRNGRDWFDLHPTLWAQIDKLSSTPAAQ
jgi:DNA polymerase III delta prime subunit